MQAVQSSAMHGSHTPTSSKRAVSQPDSDMQEAPVSMDTKQEEPSGSIAFTGPVQDVIQSMPGIPSAPLSTKQGVSAEQQKVERFRAAKSDADVAAEQAAEAEEELRAQLAREEQQEPPEDDGAAADPWAEDPW